MSPHQSNSIHARLAGIGDKKMPAPETGAGACARAQAIKSRQCVWQNRVPAVISPLLKEKPSQGVVCGCDQETGGA
jgi:hypothetical protein